MKQRRSYNMTYIILNRSLLALHITELALDQHIFMYDRTVNMSLEYYISISNARSKETISIYFGTLAL